MLIELFTVTINRIVTTVFMNLWMRMMKKKMMMMRASERIEGNKRKKWGL